ncbi:SRPBCC family protein [Noviherbaspirillum galbum]|uniref:Ribosome association toxin RatA n=1 Tax=Noviherbaspirillum galbum TaxID=2709383 RepID=A0A6B3SX21_9BURK|nr:hypothetical protein [Noviherbaspirillum galbum]NEX64055.1 hypothetical protein [Noviherbaspirillum galbum]
MRQPALITFAVLCLPFLLHSVAARAQPEPQSTGSDSDIAITDFSKPSSPGRTFAARTVINAPVQKLCGILLDYPEYPAFMPNTDNASVIQAADDFAIVNMTLKLPLGKIKKYRLRLEPRNTPQTCHLSWKQVPWEDLKADDTIADTSGYWHLVPHPANPARTVVDYFVYADPGYVPFGFRWIVDILSKESLPKTLESLRARAAELP